LLGVRDDLRQVALRFRVDEEPFLATQSDGVPLLTDRPTLLDLADRVEKDTAKLPGLEWLFRAGGSLGGARPKAHVLDDDGSLAIAKFASSDGETCNVMNWRKVTFDLARAGEFKSLTRNYFGLRGGQFTSLIVSIGRLMVFASATCVR
jgi:serine/threonine-protein kinase HipA